MSLKSASSDSSRRITVARSALPQTPSHPKLPKSSKSTPTNWRVLGWHSRSTSISRSPSSSPMPTGPSPHVDTWPTSNTSKKCSSRRFQRLNSSTAQFRHLTCRMGRLVSRLKSPSTPTRKSSLPSTAPRK